MDPATGKDPTIQQLRCFCVLAQELHYGRAAKRLHISQPPLTRHIQQLEAAVGTALFERSGRRVDLSPAGKALLPEAMIVLARLERGIISARQVAAGEAGDIAVGYVEPLGIDFLPRILGEFRSLHPRHHVRLVEMHTFNQVDALSDGQIDLALLRTASSTAEDLSFEAVGHDELVVALPEKHPLARTTQTSISLDAMRHEPFIVYEATLGSGILGTVLSACAEVGFTPRIAHSADSTPTLLSLVASGEGVAFVSREIARIARPGVAFRTVDDVPTLSEILMAWRRTDSSPALDDLRHLIRRRGVPYSTQ